MCTSYKSPCYHLWVQRRLCMEVKLGWKQFHRCLQDYKSQTPRWVSQWAVFGCWIRFRAWCFLVLTGFWWTLPQFSSCSCSDAFSVATQQTDLKKKKTDTDHLVWVKLQKHWLLHFPSCNSGASKASWNYLLLFSLKHKCLKEWNFLITAWTNFFYQTASVQTCDAFRDSCVSSWGQTSFSWSVNGDTRLEMGNLEGGVRGTAGVCLSGVGGGVVKCLNVCRTEAHLQPRLHQTACCNGCD